MWVAGLAAWVPRAKGVWVAVARAEEPAPTGTGPEARFDARRGNADFIPARNI